jgi:tetratricopeptide (TPR) repeat protein
MKQIFVTLIILTMAKLDSVTAQSLDFSKVKAFEHQLDDAMELIDTSEIKVKLKELESVYKQNPNEINKARLGIIYHETALNLSFLSKTEYKGYAQKSFDILTELFNSSETTKELLPFIASYRASALSLTGAETKKLGLLFKAFSLFDEAVKNYSHVSSYPEFLRASVSENLPWIFFWLTKYAKTDFQSIIDKQNENNNYANWKIMSFTYWAWAKQRQGTKHRTQAMAYLDKAIALDPNYKAGRQKAEDLKNKFLK